MGGGCCRPHEGGLFGGGFGALAHAKPPPKQAWRAPLATSPPPLPLLYPPPPQRLRLHHWLMISILWRVPPMSVRRFAVTRPLRCAKMIWK